MNSKFSVGDLTSVGIYRGHSACGCYHNFRGTPGNFTMIGINSKQLQSGILTIDTVKHITQDEWDAKVAARNSLLEKHFMILPSYVMD